MSNQIKFGAGHAAAMFRAGAKELAQALPAFPGHSIQPVEEPGLALNITQLEVNQEKGNAMSYEQWLDARSRQQPERETPTAERGPER